MVLPICGPVDPVVMLPEWIQDEAGLNEQPHWPRAGPESRRQPIIIAQVNNPVSQLLSREVTHYRSTNLSALSGTRPARLQRMANIAGAENPQEAGAALFIDGQAARGSVDV